MDTAVGRLFEPTVARECFRRANVGGVYGSTFATGCSRWHETSPSRTDVDGQDRGDGKSAIYLGSINSQPEYHSLTPLAANDSQIGFTLKNSRNAIRNGIATKCLMAGQHFVQDAPVVGEGGDPRGTTAISWARSVTNSSTPSK